jgi:hypothetical protein
VHAVVALIDLADLEKFLSHSEISSLEGAAHQDECRPKMPE